MQTKIEQISEVMYNLFQGKKGSYAIKITDDKGRKFFRPDRDIDGKDKEFTPEVCLKHLKGETSIGIYPIDKEDDVHWAAIDFDGKRGNVLKDAKNVKDSLLTNLGIISWLERSQSGEGIHLWIFFDKKLPAKAIRKVLRSHIPEFDIPSTQRITSYDRLFPNQDHAYGKYGNLCGLPLNGLELVKENKTVFIDETGNSYEDQSKKLLEIYESRNKREVILEVAKKIPDKYISNNNNKLVKNKTSGGFKLLSPYGCNWIRQSYDNAKNLSEPEWYDVLCQFARIENGEFIAHKFSEPYPGYKFKETQRKFEHAEEVNLPKTVKTIRQEYPTVCGAKCICEELGLKYPYEIAKIPLHKLETEKQGKFVTSKELSDTTMKIVKEVHSGKRIGFPWGYDIIDDNTALRPGNLIILAARRSIGKTAAMLDSAVINAGKGIPQYIISLEMTAEELGLRLLSRVSKVDHALITTGRLDKELWNKILEGQKEFQQLPIFIDDTTRNLDKMLDNTGELIYKHGSGCIWVDYLQLVKRSGRESKKEAVDRVILGYKQMSKILNSPVITLAQLNRMEEQYDGDDELDSWLKDSGDIEQAADVIHYIRGSLAPGIVPRKWRIHKERHRASGLNFKFLFNQSIFMFESSGDWTAQEQENGFNEYETGNGFDFV